MSLGLPAGASGALSQDAPAREDWQTEWFSVLPELNELARCTVAPAWSSRSGAAADAQS